MAEIHIVLLLCLVMAAVLSDLKSGKIPNGVIAAGLLCGLMYQLSEKGFTGFILYCGGIFLPILIFGFFYYFRMIGAGDIKLLCMAGGFFGPSGSFDCVMWAILLGGAISFGIMMYHHNISERLLFFSKYISHYSEEKQWKPYLSTVGEKAKFSFSVPILLGILCHIGGII